MIAAGFFAGALLALALQRMLAWRIAAALCGRNAAAGALAFGRLGVLLGLGYLGARVGADFLVAGLAGLVLARSAALFATVRRA
jgi:hypothetical protein